jgi:hypothetical protein
VAIERKLMEVAQPHLLVALGGPPLIADLLHRRPLEERLMTLVDRLDRQVGLLPGQMEVVLAIDLLGEELRLTPVFVEVPDDRFLIDVLAGAAQAELGARRARRG